METTSLSPEATPQPLTTPEASAQQPGLAKAQQPFPVSSNGNRRPLRCISNRGKSSKRGTPAAACNTGMEENPEQQEEAISKAEDPLMFMPEVPRERSSGSVTRDTNGNWLPETPFVSLNGMASVDVVASDLTVRQNSRNNSYDSAPSAKGAAAPSIGKTASTVTGGASSDEETPSVLFPIAEDATANLLKAKAKPKRQAKAKGRRQQSNFKSPAPTSLAHEVLLEEIEVRPGDAECFCVQCRMEPSRGGLPKLSLVEAWSGGRHSARKKELAQQAQQVPPREKRKGSGRGRTRGAQRVATGQVAPEAPNRS